MKAPGSRRKCPEKSAALGGTAYRTCRPRTTRASRCAADACCAAPPATAVAARSGDAEAGAGRASCWVPAALTALPQAFVNDQGGRHKFFNLWPYVKPLRAWVFRCATPPAGAAQRLWLIAGPGVRGCPGPSHMHARGLPPPQGEEAAGQGCTLRQAERGSRAQPRAVDLQV